MREFKEVLKGLREERRLSQKELAEDLNLGISTIGMYENGSRMPKYDILEQIADYFNVDMNYLLGKTPIRNSYRDGEFSQWGNDTANQEYLSKDPELLALYNEIKNRQDIYILFDKTKDAAFNQRMKTGKFSDDDLNKIVGALNATFEFKINFPDGTSI